MDPTWLRREHEVVGGQEVSSRRDCREGVTNLLNRGVELLEATSSVGLVRTASSHASSVAMRALRLPAGSAIVWWPGRPSKSKPRISFSGDHAPSSLSNFFLTRGSLVGPSSARKTSWMPHMVAFATWSSCSLEVGMMTLMKSSTKTSSK